METKTKVLIGAGSAAAVTGAFVAFRLYVRSETKKALVAEYNFDEVFEIIADSEVAFKRATGKSLNLPSYNEFIEALVPIWSTTMPKDALADMLQNGRDSRFWSDAHRTPTNRAIESQIFRAMRAAYETPEGASLTDIAAAATLAVVQGLTTGKKGK